MLCLLVLAGAVAGTVILRQAAPASRDDPAPAVTSATGVAAADVGRPAPSQVVPQRPEALGLPSGTSMPVDVVSTGEDGVLELPADIDRAGWWDGGSRIGEPYGAMVLAAHVDSVADGIGPFAELLRTRPGQRIRVSGTDGAAQLFEIASVRRTPRTSLSERASTFSVRGPLRLVLITCAGPFDPQRGGYRDNLVVVAKPVGRPLNGPARGH
ncbi:MAG: class F sortase [Aeromicrobium sp.]